VVAFAFFLNAEISFTLGMSQILWAAFAIPIVTAGYSLNTDYDIGGWEGWHRAGSYTAFSLMLLYTGRQYYRELATKAVCVWRKLGEDQRVCRSGPSARWSWLWPDWWCWSCAWAWLGRWPSPSCS